MIRRDAMRLKPASMAFDERISWIEFVKNVDGTGLRIEDMSQYLHIKCDEAPAAFRIGVSRKRLLPA